MKRILFFYSLLFPIFLSAQINESDTLKLKASLSLSGIWQEGNVQTLIFRARSDFSFRAGKEWVFKNNNSYVYQEFGKEKADEDILSLNFLYFRPEQKFYPLLLGFVSTNFRRKIDLRYLVGGGVTYQLVDKEKNWLKLSISSEYEQTEFSEVDFNRSVYDGTPSISTFRATLWVNGKYHLFKDKVILSHESYIQPSLNQRENYRWRADLGLELPLWKFLNFKVNYLHTRESIVVQDQKEEDTILTFGFSLKSY